MWCASMLEPGRIAAIRADADMGYWEYVRQGIRAGALSPETRIPAFGPGRPDNYLRNLAIREAVDRLYRGSLRQAYKDLSAACEAEGWGISDKTIETAYRAVRLA